VNDPAGSTPEPLHEDLGTEASSTGESPDVRRRILGREAAADDAERPHAEPTSRLPEGYEPL